MNQVATNHTQNVPAEGANIGRWYRPRVDVLDQDNEYLLLADMPGVQADSLEVRFEDGVLILSGHVQRRTPEDAQPLLTEYGVGDFRRTFRLGEDIDTTAISAHLKQGVLQLTLPKAEKARPRKIDVQVG